MKTQLVITEGKAKLVLNCESEFERDLIEKIIDSKIGYDIEAIVKSECIYHTHSKHRIEVQLLEKKQ
tara:strand:+ start:486 stop:686 length:201 start_codon:yes stop_codon:yes gene_type:complete